MMAVVAMLLLGLMAISFTALGSLESRIGFNDVRDKQAVMVAEAGVNAAQTQIQNPPDYTAFIGHEYECTPGGCTCTGAGCDTSRLASVSTGTFRVRIDNDPDDPSPTVDTNKRVMLTASGTTNDGRGRARVRAWMTNDDPWKHVCSSGDGVLCTDSPPNNANADVTPYDPNALNGPRTYPEIPRPNLIRCTPVAGGDPATLGPNEYPVPTGVTPPGNPWGPCVMYPYYLMALQTPCTQCNPTTSAYDPATCNTGTACLGMVRFDADLTIRTGGSAGPGTLKVTGGALGSTTSPITLYVTGKVTAQNSVGTIYGTIVVHGGGDAGSSASATDLKFQGPHAISTRPCGATPCAYPLAILGYNPNEPAPPGQTIYLDISNNGVVINGAVYTGGTVDFGPNTINGSVMGQTVNANNAATEFVYTAAYESALPPPGFTTPALILPSVIAPASWLQCRRADSLTAACD